VFSQTYEDLEIIVADDGSTDDTREVLEGLQRPISYIRLEHSGHPGKVRNAALRVARGEYVAFLDSDDQWLPTKLETQTALLDQRKDVGLVCANALVAPGSGDTLKHYLREDQGKSGHVLRQLLEDNFIITSTALIRRSLLTQTGLFCEDPRVRTTEDYDLWLRVAAASEIAYLPEPLAIYRDDPALSIRGQQSKTDYLRSMVAVFRRLQQYLRNTDNLDDLTLALLRQQLGRHRISLLRSLLVSRRYWDALQCAIRMTWEEPWLSVKLPCAAFRKVLRRAREGPRTGSNSQTTQGQLTSTASPDRTVGCPPRHGVRLHLGCGDVRLPGYVNVDLPCEKRPLHTKLDVDLEADIRDLCFAPETVEEVRLHHVFEHFDRGTALRLLITWYAWLEDDGRLVIETPDSEKQVKVFLESRSAEERARSVRHIFGSHEAEWACHKDGWYRDKFVLFLSALGYENLSFRRVTHKGLHSLIVTAQKTRPFQSQDRQVEEAVGLLRLSLVDDSESEQRLLTGWVSQLKSHLTNVDVTCASPPREACEEETT
jgi:glycosyltransferase involved in cell wall biosynthesis/predicted SAM-dependent methyltransferase